MQSDILNKIDVLVEMAGSSLNNETLVAELEEIEKESSRLKNELSLLENINPEEKYFKASEKQVDENIKVSLESKIRKETKSLRDIQQQIEETTSDEEGTHQSIMSLKKEIASSNNYIDSIEKRLTTLNDSLVMDKYQFILKDEKEKLSNYQTLLKEKEEVYGDILDKLNILSLAKKEMEDKLNEDKTRLKDTKSSLINPSSYIDEELKQIDDKRITEIKKQLSNLNKRRIEILTDPYMIAKEAKELIIEDDRTSALSRLRELVTIVKAKPYMDIPSGNELQSILQEELNNASNKRDEFAALIDSKDYLQTNTDVIKNRISYLNKQIENIEDKKNQLQEELKRVDTEELDKLLNQLEESIQKAKDLEQDIQDYQLILNNEEEKTPKRRAILQAAFVKKQKDLDMIHQVIDNYKENQKAIIQYTYDIENVQIKKLEDNKQKIQAEIEMLNNNLLLTHNIKDVLAIENDKKKLKEYDDNVKAIIHRQKYNITPNEIFDEIELYLGTLDDDKELDSNNINNENDIIDKDIDLNFDFDDDISKNEIFDEEKNKDNQIEENNDIQNSFTYDIMDELPFIEEESPNKEDNSARLKVVSIEPINDKDTKAEENPFIIGDYNNEDDDYIDVDSLFSSDGVM